MDMKRGGPGPLTLDIQKVIILKGSDGYEKERPRGLAPGP